MSTQDQGGGLRKIKGWYGYVHGYASYIKNTDWKAIKWDKESQCKEESRDHMGKIIQKW